MKETTRLGLALTLFMLFNAPSALAQAVNCDPDPGTDMLIEYGNSVACVFEEPSDVDVFKFVGNAGDKPHITLVTTAGGAQTTLFGPGGDELAKTNFGHTGRITNIVLPDDGIYTIVAQAWVNADNWDYTLELPCLSGKCSVNPPPELLGYTAVDPCRIVDTRFGEGGQMFSGQTRHFHTYGDISEQNKRPDGTPGAYPDECPFALGEHAAVHLNVTVVPRGPSGQGGFVTVWPHGGDRPTSSFMNFRSGQGNIANAGTVKTHSADGSTPDISVFAEGDLDLIIDVMGYYSE